MIDRMAVGFYNYGHIDQTFPMPMDALESSKLRVDHYRETKNLENLMDAANYLMIEFVRPRLESAHFKPTDSDGSPGAVCTDGNIIKNKNDLPSEKIKSRLYRREGD